MFRKWTPRDKYFKYQNFPTHFLEHYSWNIFAKFDENRSNLYPINPLKVFVFLS